jgi:hypothetical protein
MARRFFSNYLDSLRHRPGARRAGDIAAVAEFVTKQPYVSKGKWVSVAVSAGDFAAVASTADSPHGLAAAASHAHLPGVRLSTSTASRLNECRQSGAIDSTQGKWRRFGMMAQVGQTGPLPYQNNQLAFR